MSAVLGPIHEWMYNKVLVQEKIIQAVIETARSNGWDDEKESQDLSLYTKDVFPPLEAVIDLTNIHASLFGMISDVEGRYAALVSSLVQNNPERLEILEKTVYELGKTLSIGEQASPFDTYKAVSGLLLDGMPCDNCMLVTLNSPERVEVTRSMELHSSYWYEKGSSVSVYYALRKAFVNGAVEASGYSVNETSEGVFEIL